MCFGGTIYFVILDLIKMDRLGTCSKTQCRMVLRRLLLEVLSMYRKFLFFFYGIIERVYEVLYKFLMVERLKLTLLTYLP